MSSAIRTVLVALTGLPGDADVLRGAMSIAGGLGAYLAVVHVRPGRDELAASLVSAGAPGAAVVGTVIDDLIDDSVQRQAAAMSVFEQGRSQASATADAMEWRPLTGKVAVCLAEHGRAADLLVVGRDPGREGVPLDVLEQVLLAVGKPVMLIPAAPPPALPATVVLAWKDGPEAARAITAGLPFIVGAGRVVVAAVAEGRNADHSGPRLVDALRRHNPAVELVRFEHDVLRDPADVLLAEADRQGAGLLVMGAYGRSRLREIMFGGFTRRVLRSPSLPTLLVH